MEEVLKIVHIYISVTPASTLKCKKKYGFVLSCVTQKGEVTREGFGEMEGTYHKVTLAAVNKAMERLNRSCEVHIHTENVFVLNMMHYHLPAWAENGFKTSRGKEIENKEDWETFWRLSKDHIILPEPGKHEYTSWINQELERRGESESKTEKEAI